MIRSLGRRFYGLQMKLRGGKVWLEKKGTPSTPQSKLSPFTSHTLSPRSTIPSPEISTSRLYIDTIIQVPCKLKKRRCLDRVLTFYGFGRVLR